MVDGVESVTPERGRYDYSLLLQDKVVLNGHFLAEVPVVVECFGAFLSGRRPPFMYHFSLGVCLTLGRWLSLCESVEALSVMLGDSF